MKKKVMVNVKRWQLIIGVSLSAFVILVIAASTFDGALRAVPPVRPIRPPDFRQYLPQLPDSLREMLEQEWLQKRIKQ